MANITFAFAIALIIILASIISYRCSTAKHADQLKLLKTENELRAEQETADGHASLTPDALFEEP